MSNLSNTKKPADPLAAVRVAAPQGAPDASQPGQAPTTPATIVSPPAPAKEAPKVASSKPVEVERYRVKETKLISWGGQMITVREGSIVSDEKYGPRSFERMRSAGVVLELAE